MSTLRSFYSAVFILALLVVNAAGQQSAHGGGRYDQQIQEQVNKVLSSKDKWKGITASTDDGIVLLQGSVKVYIDKLDAAKKVGKVKYVEGVRNHVDVEGKVPDAELQEKLAEKLRYDRVGQGIMFDALGLKVENGTVTVSGDVRDYPSRDSALAIVETTPGVQDVIDDVNVLPNSPFDDDLRIRIARSIYRHPAMGKYAIDPQKPIRIIVENGKVSLYGVVDSAMDSQIAEMQAKSIPNVLSVENHLVVADKTTK